MKPLSVLRDAWFFSSHNLLAIARLTLPLLLLEAIAQTLLAAQLGEGANPAYGVLLGSRPRIASDEELIEQTGCVPMCACPFGHDAGITLLIDRAVLACDFLLYSPGPPELTLEVPGSELPRLLKAQPNAQLEYS